MINMYDSRHLHFFAQKKIKHDIKAVINILLYSIIL